MDLLQTVRKEGSRGGVNFSWDDVKTSQHRENYLGHSLMAPVGRWQKGKDLNWYAKADGAAEELTLEEKAEQERAQKREELRKIKEAEEDAMARALGLPVPDRSNANHEPVGESGKISQQKVREALREALHNSDDQNERGIGFGSGVRGGDGGKEIMQGTRAREERRRDRSRSRSRARNRDHDDKDDERARHRRRRSRSRSRHRHTERRHRHRNHSRSRSRSRDRKRRSRSRERHREDHYKRNGDYDKRPRSRDRDRKRHRSRSRSPYDERRRRETR